MIFVEPLHTPLLKGMIPTIQAFLSSHEIDGYPTKLYIHVGHLCEMDSSGDLSGLEFFLFRTWKNEMP